MSLIIVNLSFRQNILIQEIQLPSTPTSCSYRISGCHL